MSTKTGCAPARTTANAVAANVFVGTSTLRPATPDARSIASSASVPLDTATAYGRRLLAAKQRSNSSTSGPPERLPELRERRQKRRISLTSSSNSCTERNRAGSNTVAGNWPPLVRSTSTETLAGPLDVSYGSALAIAAPATVPVADDWDPGSPAGHQ